MELFRFIQHKKGRDEDMKGIFEKLAELQEELKTNQDTKIEAELALEKKRGND